ncbi:MAG: iron uptake porin, partial [Vulcanococcus sp.]
MHPTKPLWLAPAVLALLSPLAGAAELHPGSSASTGISQYLSGKEQLTTIEQFSDVRPTDWAYQALGTLVERYGCVAGFPNGTGRGGQAISRFEAAALVSTCLDRIGATTDTLQRLRKEFEKELALLTGHTDALEAKVVQVEATQFSTTTKLKGLATFVLGGNSFTGTNSGSQYTNTEYTTAFNNTKYGATVAELDLQLAFDTSFTGKDLLRTVLRGGNAGGDNGSAYSAGMLSTLEAFYEQPSGDNVMGVFQLFYNFPMGEELSFSAGPLVRNDDPGMLGLWPSVYPSDTVLDLFTYAGAPGTYNTDALGGGGGFVYSPQWAKGLTFSQSYVSAEGASFNNNVVTNASSGNPALGGMFTNGAGSAAITQIGYVGENTPMVGGS